MRLSEASILVVDDEPVLRQGYATWLRRNGCKHIWIAANGREALELFLAHKIDIVISDVRMPVMDGMDLLKSIGDSGRPIPIVIFISGFSNVELAVAYSLGVEAFLAKPFSASVLVDTVTKSLANREELWTTPLPEAPRAKVVVGVAIETAEAPQPKLRFGRGGFSCHISEPLPISPLHFQLQVEQDDPAIQGQGHVRWFSPETERVGVEFHYLEPTTRAAALARVAASDWNSFIPL